MDCLQALGEDEEVADVAAAAPGAVDAPAADPAADPAVAPRVEDWGHCYGGPGTRHSQSPPPPVPGESSMLLRGGGLQVLSTSYVCALVCGYACFVVVPRHTIFKPRYKRHKRSVLIMSPYTALMQLRRVTNNKERECKSR